MLGLLTNEVVYVLHIAPILEALVCDLKKEYPRERCEQNIFHAHYFLNPSRTHTDAKKMNRAGREIGKTMRRIVNRNSFCSEASTFCF